MNKASKEKLNTQEEQPPVHDSYILNSEAVDSAIHNFVSETSTINAENEAKLYNDNKAFQSLLNASYISMDDAFLGYLKNFNDTAKYQEDQKLVLKEKFFKYVMFIMIAIILFPYILVFMFRQTVTDATVITLSVSSVAETISAIIVLPKIIAKYLFNKKEEGNKLKLIENMQIYNRAKRYSSEVKQFSEIDKEEKSEQT